MSLMRVERSQANPLVSRPTSSTWHAFDVQLAFYALALAIIGLLMAWTNSPSGPLQPESTFTRGLMWFAVAIVAFSLAAAFDYHWLRTFSWLLYLVNIGLLVLTKAIGTGVGGVQRWVTIFGLQFQFSEICKVLMIAVLAAFLASRQDSLGKLTTLLGAALLAIPPFILVMIEPDLGTSLVFAAIVIGAVFLAGGSMRWLTAAGAAAVAALPIMWSVLQDYPRQRLLSFLDPTCGVQDACYQVVRSQIAVGSGGIFGKGLANGTLSSAELLPVQSTDFAFAGLLEQLGFVGGMVVLLLFVGLIWRVLLVGWRSDSVFGVAFAGGMGAMLVFQLLVNAGMVAGMMPVTGIPLPFITHGGASLTSTAIGLGILQSIHVHHSRAPD